MEPSRAVPQPSVLRLCRPGDPLHLGRPCSLLPQSRRRPEGQAGRTASLTFIPEDHRHDQRIRKHSRIYVACLTAYNDGYLHGAWIDADQDPDQIKDEIAAMLVRSPVRTRGRATGGVTATMIGLAAQTICFERLLNFQCP
ncbi:antirestriction protein ArdA [Brucella pituitosa]|uniref:antirestriction protein ArdA n=1 Tax=Brucella pituitosa TaxID=571256 RepID=UPI003F4AC6EC